MSWDLNRNPKWESNRPKKEGGPVSFVITTIFCFVIGAITGPCTIAYMQARWWRPDTTGFPHVPDASFAWMLLPDSALFHIGVALVSGLVFLGLGMKAWFEARKK